MSAVLLIKTTSLGDVLHNLPVVCDIRQHKPTLAIDWCAEEPFCALLKLNPNIRQTIPVKIRQWRKNLFQAATWREFAEFKKTLQAENYDKIIDSQGLIKSALIAKMAKGKRCGFEESVIKEKFAARFYDEHFLIERKQNALTRNRQLAAAVLDYKIDSPPDYGLNPPTVDFPFLPKKPFIVALASSSRADKMWAKNKWIALTRNFADFVFVFTAGNDAERENVGKIVAHSKNAVLAPPLKLDEIAALITQAQAVVGVDTGLTHLGAALKIPTIALFLMSNPTLTGVLGAGFCQNLGGLGGNPNVDEVAFALKKAIAQKKVGAENQNF